MNGTGPAAGTEERDIFPRSLLRDLAWAEYAGKFSPAITADQPGDGLLVRPLQRADYDKGWSEGWTVGNGEIYSTFLASYLPVSCSSYVALTLKGCERKVPPF